MNFTLYQVEHNYKEWNFFTDIKNIWLHILSIIWTKKIAKYFFNNHIVLFVEIIPHDKMFSNKQIQDKMVFI